MSDLVEQQRERWDRRHGEAPDLGQVARVLAENDHLVTPGGDALDLACGRGASALHLARLGLRVSAWDLSPVAIERLSRAAEAEGLRIDARVRDVVERPPPALGFDLILVSYFLERALVPHILAALRPGGLLFYQTFTRTAVSDLGPSNPEWRLADNELLQLFQPLRLRVYREEGRLGDLQRGCRDIAMLVGEKAGTPSLPVR